MGRVIFRKEVQNVNTKAIQCGIQSQGSDRVDLGEKGLMQPGREY